MSRPIIVGAFYLLAALAFEFGFLPIFGGSWGEFARFIPASEIRLVALGVILAGLIRDEAHALVFGLASAALAGCVPGPGHLGATMFSFVAAASLASVAARWFYLEHATVRFAVIFGLVAAESWIESSVRHAFWPEARVEMQWWAHAATAAVGTALHPVLARWLRYRAEAPPPIGRKRPGQERQDAEARASRRARGGS